MEGRRERTWKGNASEEVHDWMWKQQVRDPETLGGLLSARLGQAAAPMSWPPNPVQPHPIHRASGAMTHCSLYT